MLQLLPQLVGTHFAKLSKNGRIAFTTLAMNLAVAAYKAGSVQAWATELLQLLIEVH